MNAQEILTIAANIVAGERQRLHGSAREDFEKIAVLWGAYLSIRRHPHEPLNGVDVAHMMSLLKKARSQCGAFNPDDHVDDAGYAAIAGELAARP